MTFYEAAVQVLRDAGRPLHVKKITLLAVDQDLLSHVGRSPESTMTARLEQESKKSDEESAIQQVRPGVFALREGIDLDEVKQTIVLREPVATDEEEDDFDDDSEDDVPEESGEAIAGKDAPSRDDDDDDDDQDDDDQDDDEPKRSATSRDDDDDDGARKRRRRGRRGGRNRSRSRSEDGAADPRADERSQERSEKRADERPVRRDARDERETRHEREKRGRRDDSRKRESRGDTDAPARHRNRRSERAADPARVEGAPTTFRPLSDITGAAAEILGDAKKLPLSASSVANELANAGVGALDKLGAAGLRDTLEYANARLARQGRPPLFDETKPNFWSLATASGDSLSRSYSKLEQWQSAHHNSLEGSLLQHLGELDDAGLGTLVTLLLDRFGYTEMQRHDDVGVVTIEARAPRGLTDVRVAIRIFGGDDEVNRDSVSQLRGSLHHYTASEGVIICVGDVSTDARDEAKAPNVAPVAVIDAEDLVRQMVRRGIGLRSFNVEVACIDDGFFRELHKR